MSFRGEGGLVAAHTSPATLVPRPLRHVVQSDGHVPGTDRDALSDCLDDLSTLLIRELWPPGVEVTGFPDNFFLRGTRDAEHVKFRLKRRHLVIECHLLSAKRLVLLPESGLVDHPGLVEVVEAVDVSTDPLPLPLRCFKECCFLPDCGVRRFKVFPDLLRGEEEALQFPMEDRLQVFCWNLVSASLADVLWRVRGHVHLPAALAVRDASEQMSCPSRDALPRTFPLIEDRVARFKEFDGDDRLYLVMYPFVLRLQCPRLLLVF